MPGVVKFITSKDIPTGGENNFASPGGTKEEVSLCLELEILREFMTDI